jgi:DNA translocase ftsK
MVIVNNHKHSEHSEQMVDPGDVSYVAAQILTVAKELGINADAVGASIGPTFTEYEFTILDDLFNDGILVSFEEMLSNELQRGSAIRCTRTDKKLAIVVPHIRRLYPNFQQYLTNNGANNKANNKDRILFPIGLDLDGKTFCSSLDKISNILVCGSAGSGKSMFIHQILCSLVFNNKPEDLGLVLIDTKTVELDPYKNLKHLVFPFASSVDKANDALTWVINEISNRKTNEQVKHKPILVVIDEFADCAISNKMFHTQIEFIVENGPAFNVYIIMASQNPRCFICEYYKAQDDLSYKMLNKLFKTKVIFYMSYDSKRLINEDAAKYLLGRGDMFFSCENKCLRLQGFHVKDDTIKRLCDNNLC